MLAKKIEIEAILELTGLSKDEIIKIIEEAEKNDGATAYCPLFDSICEKNNERPFSLSDNAKNRAVHLWGRIRYDCAARKRIRGKKEMD